MTNKLSFRLSNRMGRFHLVFVFLLLKLFFEKRAMYFGKEKNSKSDTRHSWRKLRHAVWSEIGKLSSFK